MSDDCAGAGGGTGKTTTKVFATATECAAANFEAFIEIPGDSVQYSAHDSGYCKALRYVPLPRIVELKPSCPVILLADFGGLKKGSLGIVTSTPQGGGGPVVQFGDAIVTVERVQFKAFDNATGEPKAVRSQFPLLLAFALTVNQCRFARPAKVEVDARYIVRTSQLDTVKQCVENEADIRIINFNPERCTSHAPVRSPEAGRATSTGDSQSRFLELIELSELELEDDGVELTEDDLELLAPVANRDTLIHIQPRIDEFLRQPSNTPFQVAMKDAMRLLMDREPLQHFMAWCGGKVEELFSSCGDAGDRQLAEKELAAAYAGYQQFLVSADYRRAVEVLFERPPKAPEWQAVYQLVSEIQKRFLEKCKDKVPVTAYEGRRRLSDETSTGARAKLRYIAGAVVAKLRTQKRESVAKLCRSPSDAKRERLRTEMEEFHVLSSLTLTREEVVEAEPGTLAVIDRRQNERQSLTHVSEKTFQFFKHLFDHCIVIHYDLLSKESRCVNEKAIEILKGKEELLEMFSGCVDASDETIKRVYKLIAELTSRIHLKEFRRDIKQNLQYERTLALRTQLTARKSKSEGNFFSKFIDSPPETIQILLKDYVSRFRKLPSIKPKKSLIKICQLFDLNIKTVNRSRTDNVPVLMNSLHQFIQQKIDETGDQPASEFVSEVELLAMNEESESEVLCKRCGHSEPVDVSPDWINCDTCSGWLHRYCAGLSEKEEWDLAQDSSFICELCLK